MYLHKITSYTQEKLTLGVYSQSHTIIIIKLVNYMSDVNTTIK